MRNLPLSAAMTAMLLASSAASAAIILDQTNTVAAGLPTTAEIESTNDAGYTGAVEIGQLRVDEAGYIQVEYLGKEAGYVNQLNLFLGGTLVFSTAGQSSGFSSSGVFSSEF